MCSKQRTSLPLLAVGLVFFAAGCALPEGGSPQSPVLNDSTTVVLSKFYRSQNYRIWLNRLAQASDLPPMRFVQAYGAEASDLNAELDRAGAVVLTGGEDVHPARYGQAADTVKCGRIDPERDRVEHLLLDRVLSQGIPCLGVCRGLQVMNVHGGGTLRPHLPDDGFVMHRGGDPGNSKDTLHPVIVTQSWSLGRTAFPMYKAAAVVSHHHQGIGVLASGYDAWAISPDSLIEGIRYRDTAAAPFLVGVQWHPERSDTGLILTDGLGQSLLIAAQQSRQH